MSGGGWRGALRGSRRRRSFLLFALGSIGTFTMAARAVGWLDGPSWLALAFLAAGLVLAGYYLVKALSRPQTARSRKR
ncbi:hypothetical protein [Arthrobacter sp. Leaf69]|uniref:hypothetical protein n=1 Tax=Arthrobacter sp. Leaf69 TaxID=1736232 RepID=UPI0006F1F055|nr:hypothetical protein [Arthrobacter sp. Leaf69]KQN95387.1 hypothetical protein ASE96_04285 [Arthrobacter sp. Leaf69]